jgi:LmbE family N-acetylglucosaminyl deacetylase
MKIIFVFAHPDDESFSSGGTIIKMSQAGHEIKLITATKGEAGLVGEPPLTTQDKLGEVREKEHANAAKHLGISQIYYLGYMDGEVKNVKKKELQTKILDILEKEKPDIVVTFDKRGGSNHPDHIAVSIATTKIFPVYLKKAGKPVKLYHTARPRSEVKYLRSLGHEYLAFGKVSGVPDHRITTVVDIKDVYETKLKALREHKTQHLDLERHLKWAEVVNLKKECFQLIFGNSLV